MPPRRFIASLFIVTASTAVAIDLRVACFNVHDGVGAPDSVEFNAVHETLRRLNPDVIAFSEVTAQNASPSHNQFFADLRTLMARLGFPTTREHLAIAGDAFPTQSFSAGDFGNSTQSLAVASRFPITRTVQISRGVANRKEMTRYPLFVEVDVPGTANDPAFVVVHLKQGDALADRFRKAIEGWRIAQFLATEGLHGSSDPLIVLGDFNEEVNEPQPVSFATGGLGGGHTFTDGSTLPQTFQMGADVPATLPYATFPDSAFTATGLSILPAAQADGETDRTYHVAGNARLDYIMAGAWLKANGAVRTEVFNSRLEHAFDGLPKDPGLADPELTELASDHHVVFADFALDPGPQLAVSAPTQVTWVGPNPGGPSQSGTVFIPQPATLPIDVTISPFRSGALRPVRITIAAGATWANFETPVDAAGTGPDRHVTVVARADGYRDGVGTVQTRRRAASGDVIFTQYTETPSGTSPKAVEIMNVSRRDINFGAEPLTVLRYTNGSAVPAVEARVEIGTLPRGAVLVIGDDATGEHLVREGRLAEPGAPFNTFPNGWVFTGTGGNAVFVKDAFTFNGNDALEVQLNFVRCDVFGRPGVDPGTEWAANGISTANQNLSRVSTALAGSSGWDSPTAWFERVTESSLSGFGAPPGFEDPYLTWAAARGLSGADAEPEADPDGDGLPNLAAFLFGGHPGDVFEFAMRNGERVMTVHGRLASLPGNVRHGGERWTGAAWERVWEAPARTSGATSGYVDAIFEFPAGSPSDLFRFYVVKP
jgi:endonuclease/exonuclease/phosphatase family metal-dependent hydrolase